jgi:hypothetical protein
VRQFRALQEEIRLGVWEYAESIGYNPFFAMIAMALSGDTPLELRLKCHMEVAAYLLPKLKAIALTGEVQHTHTSMPLQALFAALEQEEEQERASLPPWTPPGREALGMPEQGDGTWDLEDRDDDEEEV